MGRAPRRPASHLLREGGGGDRGTRRAGRSGHDRGDGQAAPRGAHGDVARGRDPPLRSRRGVSTDRRDVRAVGGRPAALHPAPSARRGRAHHAVELPDRDPRLEARSRAHLRQHARAQAGLRGSANGAPRRGVLRRSRAARRGVERAHRCGLESRRRDRLERRRARDLVHRFRAGWTIGAGRGDRARLPRAARARRTQPADRHRHGRARPRRRGFVRRRVLVGRTEVHGDAAHPDRRLGVRRIPREAARSGRGRKGRRSGGSRGRGRPRRERGARWRRSSERSSGHEHRVAPSLPAASVPTTRATSSVPPSSRGSQTTPSSRARRSSVR